MTTQLQTGSSETPPTGDVRQVFLSESAAARVKVLREKEGNSDLMLRLTVSGGGCSGFQYGFDFDTEIREDDHVFETDGVKLLIDDVSLDLVTGSTVTFKTELMGAYFEVENPLASSSCGCGTSFSI